MILRSLLILLLQAMMLGCASTQVAKQPTYAETILNRPLPPDETTRLSECASLESEMHRQQGALGYAASLQSGSPKRDEVMSTYHNNTGVLKTRMMQLGCGRHMPSATPPASSQ